MTVKITNRETGLTRDATQEDIDAVAKAEYGVSADGQRHFFMSAKEWTDSKKFMRDHNCKIEGYGTIGDKETYSFTPTSLGTIVGIKCGCGATKTLTDFSEW